MASSSFLGIVMDTSLVMRGRRDSRNYSITPNHYQLEQCIPSDPMTPETIAPSEHSVTSNTLKDEYIMVLNIVTS